MRLLALGATVASLLLPSAAAADTFNVTKTGDDLTCAPGNCSLRGAIEAANATAGADTINVPAGHYVLTGNSGEDANQEGDLDVRQAVTIAGAGAGSTVVDAGRGTAAEIGDRVFDVQPQGGAPVTVAISDLTIQGGSEMDLGTGVRSNANLTLAHVTVTGNWANELSFSEGGGVLQLGDESTLRIADSTVSNNRSTQGSGVAHVSSATNQTDDVGLVVERSTIVGNSSLPPGEGDPDGGGISITNGGDAHIRTSTITGNSVTGSDGDASGGGIYATSGSHVEVTNSTIHDNSATSGYGGGIANIDAVVSLLNVTLADNDVNELTGTRSIGGVGTASVADPGAPGVPGANVESLGGTTNFKNTIVSGGNTQNCRGRFSSTFTSTGHNLESADTCGFDQGTDVKGSDPKLGPLASNGGPTQTRALLAGSPAIDTADNSACPAADQRGIARPQPAGGTCDRGAYERPAIDLSIQKLASASAVRAGQEVRFTLAVANAGPGDATGVRVTDSLPDGLSFVAAEPSQGTCSGTATVTCELGTVAAEQSVDVVIRATATRAGTFTNTAAVTSDGSLPEPNQSNNNASATVTATATDPEPCVDRVAPITHLKQSRVRVRRGKVHLSGTTSDPNPCASGVNRVLVSLARVKGRHLVNCRFLRSKTRYLLTPAPGMNCQDPILFLAKGGVTRSTERASYSFIFFVDLPDGIYRAQARAFDNAGNKEKPTKGRNIRKFFVR